MTRTAEEVHHPAPARHNASPWLLFFAVFGAPLAWFAMLNVGYISVTNSCFEERGRRLYVPLDGYTVALTTIIVVFLICLAIAVAATVLSVRLLRKTRDEVDGGHRHLLEIGGGRTRFLAMWGVFTGVSFGALLLINALALLVVPPCSG